MSTSNVLYQQLGKNGPQVAALGFGAMGMFLERESNRLYLTPMIGLSAFYGNRVSDEESLDVVRMVKQSS